MRWWREDNSDQGLDLQRIRTAKMRNCDADESIVSLRIREISECYQDGMRRECIGWWCWERILGVLPGGAEFFCLTLFVHVLMLVLQESFCFKRRNMLWEAGERIFCWLSHYFGRSYLDAPPKYILWSGALWALPRDCVLFSVSLWRNLTLMIAWSFAAFKHLNCVKL